MKLPRLRTDSILAVHESKNGETDPFSAALQDPSGRIVIGAPVGDRGSGSADMLDGEQEAHSQIIVQRSSSPFEVEYLRMAR